MSSDPRAESPSRSRLRNGLGAGVRGMFAVSFAAAGIAALAVHRLRDYPYPIDVRAALGGVASVVDVTGPTAMLVWGVIAAHTWAIGRWVRRTSDLSVGEAAAAAIVLLWGGGYLALLFLGPAGLYRPAVLRTLMVVAFVGALAASRGKSPLRRAHVGVGPWVAAAAFALAAGPLLLMQLGSPVSPFMDVLPYVASTEKIVTFRFYEPLENDAAGIWPPSRQVPGCDGVLSLLALVVGRPARFTITSLIVPTAAFNLLALYLLGRNLGGGLAGAWHASSFCRPFSGVAAPTCGVRPWHSR